MEVGKINETIFLLLEKENEGKGKRKEKKEGKKKTKEKKFMMIAADQTFFLAGMMYAVSGHTAFLAQ